jgi:hypothetical protein
VIFYQKESKNNLYALFAYPLEKEKDIYYLQQIYQDSLIKEVREYIEKLIMHQTFSNEQKFEFEINLIGNVDNQTSFLKLVSKIKEYELKNYRPKYSTLEGFCKDQYLIQLWEMGIISECNIEIIKKYFDMVSADKKRSIINLLSETERNTVIIWHFENLKLKGFLDNTNNRLKTLLDITFRNEISRNYNVYNSIKNYILEKLKPFELLDLYGNGYINDLPFKLIIDNFEYFDQFIDLLAEKEYNTHLFEMISDVYENYLLDISNGNFNSEFPVITKRLIRFEKYFNSRFHEISNAIWTKLDEFQKYSLWIFNVKIDFDAHEFLKANYRNIDIFYKIKYFLHETIDQNDSKIHDLLVEISFSHEELIIYAKSNPWNSLIHPTETLPINNLDCYFLPEIAKFINKYEFKDFSFNNIGLSIFESLSKYQVYHLRLWLFDYVNRSHYEYVGFREGFKKLTIEEQKVFKLKGEEILYNEEVINPELFAVEHCVNIIESKENSNVYLAKLENLYFNNGSFRIKKSDKHYSNPKREPYASSGFNRIPKSSNLNKIEIIIEVSNENEIIYENGLVEIFTKIHTGEIEDALGKVSDFFVNAIKRKKITYIEDWKLRKEVIDYLNLNQFKEIEPKSVFEPKNNYRHLDENSGITSKELTYLYSIKTSDGYGIVWENIDFTKERATFLFKCENESHENQINKIAQSIITLAQFRSTLKLKKLEDSMENEKLIIFKMNLGYIGSINKKRGYYYSFENWHKGFSKLIANNIPVIPSSEELERIMNWSPSIPHHPVSFTLGSINPHPFRKPKLIEPGDIPKGYQYGEEKQINSTIENSDYTKYNRIIEALEKFNTKLSEII